MPQLPRRRQVRRPGQATEVDAGLLLDDREDDAADLTDRDLADAGARADGEAAGATVADAEMLRREVRHRSCHRGGRRRLAVLGLVPVPGGWVVWTWVGL